VRPASANDYPTALVGRDEGLACVHDAIAASRHTSGVLHITGARGLGRSVVLESLAHAARRSGARVLAAAGERGDPPPLSAIHALFGPHAALAADLRCPHRDTLARVFGDPAGQLDLSDVSAVADALAALIVPLTIDRPLVLTVDDLDLVDDLSRAALAALAERLPCRNVLLAHTAVSSGTPSVTVNLLPLDEVEAERLADRQPVAPSGIAARTIIEQAAGNPLAIVELAALTARRPDLARTVQVALPPTPRLAQAFDPQCDRLPDRTRRALRLVAAGAHDLAVLATMLDDAAAVWKPAVQAGLITAGPTTVRFMHPMTAAVMYYANDPGARRRTHRALARALASTDPVGAGWQLALAGDSVDAGAAALLERRADQLIRRADYAAAARLLAAASQLSMTAPDAVRRAELAVRAAAGTVWVGWDEQLVAELRLERQPANLSGTFAIDQLIRTVEDAYVWGDDNARAAARTAAKGSIADPESATDEAAERFWAGIVADPSLDREGAIEALRSIRRQPPRLNSTSVGLDQSVGRRTGLIGLAASALDETDDAIQWFEQAGTRLGRFDSTCLGALQWAYFDAGRFDDAGRQSDAISSSVAGRTGAFARDSADLVRAILAGLRTDGGTTDVLQHLSRSIDPREQPYLAARLRHGRALVAAGAGDHAEAWRQLAGLFGPDGTPIHYLLCDLALGDLAAAAHHSGHVDDAAKLVAESLARTTSGPSIRLNFVLHRAQALLAEPVSAEHHFRLALVHPGGERWPVERALARMDYAEWLRRRQRPSEARELFTAARETFVARGMRAWTRRADGELRAAGGNSGDEPTAQPHRLTTQQRHVALLAAAGLSNQQIAARLALSSRTVSSHLSRAFVALGVRRRTQIKAALTAREQPRDE
jgi:DNA-binding CsgD family transcriptional regulator